jgi:acetyl-CoA synthetase
MSELPFNQPPVALAESAGQIGGLRQARGRAAADYSGFWSPLAREFLSWKTPFTKVLDESNAPFFKWFEDGTLNVSYTFANYP